MNEAEIKQFEYFLLVYNSLSPNVQHAFLEMFEQVQNSVVNEEETIFPKIHKN